MNCFKYLLLFAVVLVSGSAQAQAVRLPGAIDMMPNINATISGAIGTKRAEILAGTNRIKAGRASNKFTPTRAGTAAVVSQMSFDPDEPQTQPEQIKFVQNQVARFNVRVRNYGLTANDLADGYVAAFSLSQEAYRDEPVNTQSVQNAAREIRADFLKNTSIQGASDVERQRVYELRAAMAIQAIEWREKARNARNQNDRRIADRKAKEFATYNYKP